MFGSSRDSTGSEITCTPFSETDTDAGTMISYNIPVTGERFTTTGVMFGYQEKVSSVNDIAKRIDRLINQEILETNSNQKITFPLTRVYINGTKDKIFQINATLADKFDCDSLINRLKAYEPGSFYSTDGLILDGKTYFKFASFNNSEEENLSISVQKVNDIEQSVYSSVLKPIESKDFYFRAVSIIFIGLLVWIACFLLFHYPVIFKLSTGRKIGLAILAYIVYAFVSTVFSFMYGFGFVLGIVAVESLVRKAAGEFVLLKLLAYGFVTAFVTSLVILVFG